MQTPLVPAQLARDEPGDLGEEQAVAGRDRGHGEREPELVSPDRAAHELERPPDAEDREHCQDEEDGDDRLSRPRPGRQGPGWCRASPAQEIFSAAQLVLLWLPAASCASTQKRRLFSVRSAGTFQVTEVARFGFAFPGLVGMEAKSR